jgi:hypothetical protein
MTKRYALLTATGTACSETVLNEDEFTPDWRSRVEEQCCARTDRDAPLPNTWTDVTDNEACDPDFDQ